MFMIGGFNPLMPLPGYKAAEQYSRRLAQLGRGLSIGCWALLLVPLTQCMALALAGALLCTSYLLGRNYRCHVDDVLEQTSALKLITLFAPCWQFLVITTLLLGVGVGLSEWSFFAQQKHALMSMAGYSILHALKECFASK